MSQNLLRRVKAAETVELLSQFDTRMTFFEVVAKDATNKALASLAADPPASTKAGNQRQAGI